MRRCESTKLIIIVCEVLILFDGALCSRGLFDCSPKLGLSGLECSFVGNFSKVQSLKEEINSSNVSLNRISALRLQNVQFNNFSIKSSFYKLDNLKKIVINNSSGLRHLEYIKFDRKLETIEVTNCGVEEADETSLINLLRLVTLKLNNNMISILHEKAFELNKLESLDLSFNRISWLPVNIFSNCVNLRYFKLSSNLIKEIPATLFIMNEKIVEIFLNNNKILAIEKCAILKFKLLKKFDLKGNICTNESFNISNSVQLIRIQKYLTLCNANYEMMVHLNATILQSRQETASSLTLELLTEDVKSSRPSKLIKNDSTLNWKKNNEEDFLEEAPSEVSENHSEKPMKNKSFTAVTVTSIIDAGVPQCLLLSLSISASTLLIVAAMLYLTLRQLNKTSSKNNNIQISTLRYESEV